jgi:hypothetical protein
MVAIGEQAGLLVQVWVCARTCKVGTSEKRKKSNVSSVFTAALDSFRSEAGSQTEEERDEQQEPTLKAKRELQA